MYDRIVFLTSYKVFLTQKMIEIGDIEIYYQSMYSLIHHSSLYPLSTRSFIHSSIYPSSNPSIRLSINPSIHSIIHHPPIRTSLSIHPSLLNHLRVSCRQLILLCDQYDCQFIAEHISPVAVKLAHDRVAQVRETSSRLVRGESTWMGTG